MSFSYVAKTKTHSRLKITGFTDIYMFHDRASPAMRVWQLDARQSGQCFGKYQWPKQLVGIHWKYLGVSHPNVCVHCEPPNQRDHPQKCQPCLGDIQILPTIKWSWYSKFLDDPRDWTQGEVQKLKWTGVLLTVAGRKSYQALKRDRGCVKNPSHPCSSHSK